jgi:pyruvate dehydrogenase E1 component alpha subunit
MVLIRRFEEECARLYQAEEIRGFLHLCIGQEAVAAGVMAALEAEDAVVSTHRDHGHALARGIDPAAVMAELLGRATGCSKGRGGSMHLFDAARRFYGGNAIVASGLPVGAGLALADALAARHRVTAVFFGEGAVTEGEFHETMNLASLWHLPLLLCCENNRYAMGTAVERSQTGHGPAARAATYGVASQSVDGMDALAVTTAAASAAAAIRTGNGPRFLEFATYRYRAHSMYDPELYRSKAEVTLWKSRDPIERLRRDLAAAGALSECAFARLVDETDDVVRDAVRVASSGGREPPEDLGRFVYSETGS